MQNGTAPVLNRSVLVLNQSYEPLHICSVRRAIVLIFRGRAQVVEELDDLCVRSVASEFPVPSVVRLDFYVRIPPKPLALTKRNILKRDGYQCQYCGTKRGPFTVDHVVPKTRGGRDTWGNLVCACHRCNNRKGSRTPEQAQLPLKRKPHSPNNVTFIRHLIGVPDERWRPYLFMEASD